MPQPRSDWALFLDVDGTLVELTDHPDQVQPAPELVSILHHAAAVFDGALALVTGRTIESVDAMLGSTGLIIAGQHGQHIRNADGQIIQMPPKSAALDAACRRARILGQIHPALFVEDKTAGVAVHYRNAPELAATVHAFGDDIAAAFEGTIEVLNGKAVVEIKPAGYDKGTAVHTLMSRPPFSGRRPVFVGDDITDENGFCAANDVGGESIRVMGRDVGTESHGTVATHELSDVKEVHQWLRNLTTTLKTETR